MNLENKLSDKRKIRKIYKTKGRIKYFTFSTRLKFEEKNELRTWCRIMETTPSEFIRELILKKFEEEKK